MERILVGSAALQQQCEKRGIPSRKPKDRDYYLRGVGKKIINRNEDSHGIPEEIFDYIVNHPQTIKHNEYCVPHINILYTIKLSHSFFPIHWDKTAHDILWFQKVFRRSFIAYDEKLFKMLYDFWLVVHKNNKNKVNLMKSNEDFFKDRVKRVYVHDDIHAAIAAPELPMYFQMKTDKSVANLPFSDFNKFDYSKKFALCKEEITVTALERFLIPSNFNKSKQFCYRKAIELLVTSMTKGWFPLFIMTNYEFLHEVDTEMIQKFLDAKEKGLVRKVEWDITQTSKVS